MKNSANRQIHELKIKQKYVVFNLYEKHLVVLTEMFFWVRQLGLSGFL